VQLIVLSTFVVGKTRSLVVVLLILMHLHRTTLGVVHRMSVCVVCVVILICCRVSIVVVTSQHSACVLCALCARSIATAMTT